MGCRFTAFHNSKSFRFCGSLIFRHIQTDMTVFTTFMFISKQTARLYYHEKKDTRITIKKDTRLHAWQRKKLPTGFFFSSARQGKTCQYCPAAVQREKPRDLPLIAGRDCKFYHDPSVSRHHGIPIEGTLKLVKHHGANVVLRISML